ncbi:TPA: hypothetical protein ENS27_16670 [bacterium]|nr:hypothetical protein [bacterium]
MKIEVNINKYFFLVIIGFLLLTSGLFFVLAYNSRYNICSSSNNWCGGADIDKNRKLDGDDAFLLDRAIVQGGTCSTSNNWCAYADINRDGRVNAEDNEILSNSLSEGGVANPAIMGHSVDEIDDFEDAVKTVIDEQFSKDYITRCDLNKVEYDTRFVDADPKKALVGLQNTLTKGGIKIRVPAYCLNTGQFFSGTKYSNCYIEIRKVYTKSDGPKQYVSTPRFIFHSQDSYNGKYELNNAFYYNGGAGEGDTTYTFLIPKLNDASNTKYVALRDDLATNSYVYDRTKGYFVLVDNSKLIGAKLTICPAAEVIEEEE